MDVTIEGSGKSLLIKSTGSGVGASFYTSRSPYLDRIGQEIEDRSTDAIWDVAIRFYDKTGGLFSEDRIVINRYTGSIEIEYKNPPASINATSKGACKRHTEKKF